MKKDPVYYYWSVAEIKQRALLLYHVARSIELEHNLVTVLFKATIYRIILF